jgi:two-component system response regulator MtrA
VADRILLVEDNPDLGSQIQEQLTEEGFEVTWLQDGDEAYVAEVQRFRLIILDLMLPGTHGFDLLKRFRSQVDVPVLILSARGEAEDRVRGLQLGADDYLVKPFWPEELRERIKARLRRPGLVRENDVEVGQARVRLDEQRVEIDGTEVSLTQAEFNLLAALIRRRGQALSRSALAAEALPEETTASDRVLDSHVSRLRKKLGESGKQIETVWGVGYRLRRSE